MFVCVYFLRVQSDRPWRENALSCVHAFIMFCLSSPKEHGPRPRTLGSDSVGPGRAWESAGEQGFAAGAVGSLPRLQQRARPRLRKDRPARTWAPPSWHTLLPAARGPWPSPPSPGGEDMDPEPSAVTAGENRGAHLREGENFAALL